MVDKRKNAVQKTITMHLYFKSLYTKIKFFKTLFIPYSKKIAIFAPSFNR